MINFWNLVFYKAFSNLVAENQRTYLSFVWWFLEPLLLMAIYYYVFGVLLQVRTEDFVSYLMVGLIVWQWFFRTVTNCSNSIVESGPIISKIPINKAFFPLVVIVSDTIKSIVVYAVLFVYLWGSDYEITSAYVYLPFLFISQFLLIVGVSLWAALLVPFLPDLKILINSLLMAGMFASGIFYSTDLIPPEIIDYFYLNPMAFLIDSYREILLHNRTPNLELLINHSIVFIVLIVSAYTFVRKYNNSFIKVVLR